MRGRRPTCLALALGGLLLALAFPAAPAAQTTPAPADPFAAFAAAIAALIASAAGAAPVPLPPVAPPPVAPPPVGPPPVAPPPVAPPPVAPPPVPPPVAPPAGAVGTNYHGVNGQFLWDPAIVGAGAAADAFMSTQLDGMRAEGLTLVRYGAPWSLMEQAAPVSGVHVYQWAFADKVVTTLARKGLRWYAILGSPPQWAGGSPAMLSGCPLSFAAPLPNAVASFAAFAGAFAARYGAGGSFWSANPSLTALPVQQLELFNEPNFGCFFNTGTDDAPARYAEIYANARVAVRAAAPQTTLVSGGLAPGAWNPTTRLVEPKAFVTRMIAARPALASELDALGFHPYAPTADQTFGEIAALRATLDAATPGRKVPIEVNEAGWFTQGAIPGDFWGFVPPITETQRAAMLKQLATDLPASNCAVTRFIPHTWISPELNPWSFSDWFGIVARNGVKKASATSYGIGLRAARASTSTTVLRRCA